MKSPRSRRVFSVRLKPMRRQRIENKRPQKRKRAPSIRFAVNAFGCGRDSPGDLPWTASGAGKCLARYRYLPNRRRPSFSTSVDAGNARIANNVQRPTIRTTTDKNDWRYTALNTYAAPVTPGASPSLWKAVGGIRLPRSSEFQHLSWTLWRVATHFPFF
jgi:hypothetical protein